MSDMVEAGNIDLHSRPRVKNADGSISTVRSMSVNFDGLEVLIPTVSDDGRILSDDAAIKLYMQSGKHLGKFKTVEAATSYAQQLHKEQEQEYVAPLESDAPTGFNSESKGLNVEITPAVAELGTAGTSSTSLLEPSPMVRTYDPSRDINKLQDEAGFFTGMGAYLTEESLYRAIYDGFDEPAFSADNNFNALNTFRSDKATASLSPDFQEELLGAVSQEDYNHRWKRIKDKQIAQRAMGEAPVGTYMGAMIDAHILLGMGVTQGVRTLSLGTQLGRGQAMLTGAAIGGVTVGGVSAATGYRSNEQIMWDAVSGAAGGLLDGFRAVPRANAAMPTVPQATGAVPNGSTLHTNVVSAIDKFNTGFKGYVSSYDKLRNYVGDVLANKLLANPVDDVSESAVAYGRSTLLEADRALVGLERAIRAEVPQWKSLRPSTRAAARAETQELGREARQWLNRAQQMEANGITPPPHPNPRVQRIVDAYVKGDFGNIMGKAAQDAGVFGADALTPSKYYVPVRHAYLKMQQFVESGNGSWTDLHKMYGQQIARIYPRLVLPEAQGGLGLSAEAIGKKFVYTQKLRQADPKAQAFRGTTQDELAQVLRAEGIEEGKIKGLLSTLQPKAEEAGKQKHLRHRMDWDYNATFVGSKGEVISINDFMDDDLLGNLQTYARSMSGRIGLARMGFAHDLDLDAALGEALDKLPAAERPKAQEFFNNVRAQLLGQPVGEQAPDWFRTATSYGASVQLGNSGAYAVADYAQLIHEFGITKVAKHFIGAMSNVVKPTAMTKAQAETLQDIMSGQLIAEGRVRPYVTHLEDNWTGPAGSIHELAQYGGQYVRFLNGSEFVRRHQINILAGIMDDLVTQAGAGNAKAVKYFKSVGMSDADLVAMQQQVQKHGTLMDNWDTTVRARSMNAITSAGDNVVMTIRHGEQPAFVEHSAIGRVLFPYMRYVFGATQKILRRNYNRGSATGIALYMSAAVPLSTMSGMLSNIIQGRDPKEDLVVRTIRALPAMGLASLLADGFIQGSVGGAAPAFAGPNNLFSIADKAKRGELTVEDVLKSVPGVNTFLPTRMLFNSLNEDD